MNQEYLNLAPTSTEEEEIHLQIAINLSLQDSPEKKEPHCSSSFQQRETQLSSQSYKIADTSFVCI